MEAREPVLFVLRSELCPKEGYGKAWSLRARWTRAAEAAPRLRLGRGTPEGRTLRGQSVALGEQAWLPGWGHSKSRKHGLEADWP